MTPLADTLERPVQRVRPAVVATDDVEAAMRRAGLDIRPIPIADDPSPAMLRRVVDERRGPMLFRGLADGWPARTEWVPEHLVERYGDKVVTALVDLPGQGVLFPKDQRAYERTLRFGEFLDLMLTASPDAPCYLGYTRAASLFPASDYDFAGLLGAREGSDTRVWVGSAGTRSMLHSDLKDNLFCQVWGEKKVVLLPWEHSQGAYPFPDNIVNSRVDLAHPDVRRFPRLAQVPFLSGAVRPGDVLYIPRGCWHDFRSRTPSISINHWFGAPLQLNEYLRLLGSLGPRAWGATARDFVRHGVLQRSEKTLFFFSPPSTGKRLYDAVRWRNFNRDNDPAADAS